MNSNLSHFEKMIGQSEEISHVLDIVDKVAQSEATVLIMGESGTGKELVAKAVHRKSKRSYHAFVPVNCGAIPRELLESELFGHVRGAFTGAVSRREGRFSLAEKGVIFFDEIGEMSPQAQVKLLRVLQERKFEPVGSTRSLPTDVRVIGATNVNLEQAMKEGRFREDLFYRLNVVPIHIPPLRKRKSDIPLLVHYFIKFFNQVNSSSLKGVTSQALQSFLSYPWPGNIRELENLIERLSILKKGGMIDVGDLPEKYREHKNVYKSQESKWDFPDFGLDFNSAVNSYENSLILKALEKTGWNRNQAAILLKLNRTTLVEKMKKKGLRPPEEWPSSSSATLNSLKESQLTSC